MSKSSASTILSDVKVFADYNITDTSLDSMIYKAMNYAVRKVRNWMIQYGIYEDTTTTASFKTIAEQAYIDITKAHIVGNASTFTGTAGDTVTVTIDGTAYAGISLAACTTIATVVTAINTGVGSTVASADENGYLMITSLTTGSSSSVTIADTAGTATDSLFEDDADKTQSAITDLDDLLRVRDYDNDRTIPLFRWEDFADFYPDPTSDYADGADSVSRLGNYIYFGPTPSSGKRYYLDYFKMISEITSSSTMPFTSEYDELIVSLCIEWLYMFFDSKDRSSILSAKERTAELKKTLITNSPKRIGVVNQVHLRGDVIDRGIAPRFAE